MLAALLGTSSAVAEPARRVAVVVASQVNTSADDSALVARSLEQVLADRGETLVPWAESHPKLPSDGLPPDCLTNSKCIRDLGKSLGADDLLFLAIVRVGSSIQVDLSWASTAAGLAAVRARIALEAFDDSATDVFRGKIQQILPRTPPAAVAAPTKAAPAPAPRKITRGVWIAGGISVAALLGATSLGLYAGSLYGDCDENADSCSHGELDDIDRTALLGDTLLVGGLAAGITAAVLYYRSSERSRPPLTLQHVPGGVGLGYHARF